MLDDLSVLTDYKTGGEVCVDLRGVSSMVRLEANTRIAIGGNPGEETPERTRVVIGSANYLVAETPAEIRAIADERASQVADENITES